METGIISHLVGSAQHSAISDDSLKDDDNAAWVLTLDCDTRSQWLERIEWIRLADRLAENQLLEAGKSEFQVFSEHWQVLFTTGAVVTGSAYETVFKRMQTRWFGSAADPITALNVQAWNRYLIAVGQYHTAQMIIPKLSHYTAMLEELAGSFFQVLPFLSERHWQSVYQFGAVDQFYNNLRDMREDAEQGICYLPTEILDRFSVTRAEILTLRACQNPGYRPMMEFWVEDYLSRLYHKACRFIMTPDLHPSWQILRAWSLNRYRRIERVLRQCEYDYVLFPQLYWQTVRQDLFPNSHAPLSETLIAAVMNIIVNDHSSHLMASLGDCALPEAWAVEAPSESIQYEFAPYSVAGTGDRDCRYSSSISA
jgi:15-cis-phytoene synthase